MIQDPHVLLPIAYRAAAKVVRSPLLAEEAGERAIHLLTMAVLQGVPPQHPEAWLRSVARRSACALLRSSWARTHAVDNKSLELQQAPYRLPRPQGFDVVRERIAGELSPRQQAALTAAVTCNGTRAAARSCGMQPRDFRRQLVAISRKARRLLPLTATGDAFADDVAVQFQLDR